MVTQKISEEGSMVVVDTTWKEKKIGG